MLQLPSDDVLILGDYIDEDRLASELGVSTRTLIRWRRLRDAPAHTRIGRRVLYHRDDVWRGLLTIEPRLPEMKPGLPIDREHLLALLEALDASPSLLRLDECGWWVIKASRGFIGIWSDRPADYLLGVGGNSKRHWSGIKRQLSFCVVTQDGDEGGVLRLMRLPTPDEAKIIREVVGVRKRPTFAPDILERKRASMARASAARGSAKTPTKAPDIAPDPIVDPGAQDAVAVDVAGEVK